MGFGVIFLFTCLFGALGFGAPAFIPETNPNRDIIKLMITMSKFVSLKNVKDNVRDTFSLGIFLLLFYHFNTLFDCRFNMLLYDVACNVHVTDESIVCATTSRVHT